MASVNNPLELGLTRYFNSGDFTDPTIKCGEHQFKVHRVIVCAQSDFLDRLCKSKLKESVEGVVNLEHDDPTVLKTMLHWMYKSTYDGDIDNSRSPSVALAQHVQVYAIADKYNVTELKARAVAAFTAQAKDYWNAAQFIQALRLIFDDDKFPQHDEDMANAAYAQLRVHVKELTDSAEFLWTINQVGGIGSLMISAMYSDNDIKSVKTYKCSSCYRVIRMDSPSSSANGNCYFCRAWTHWPSLEQK